MIDKIVLLEEFPLSLDDIMVAPALNEILDAVILCEDSSFDKVLGEYSDHALDVVIAVVQKVRVPPHLSDDRQNDNPCLVLR